MRKIQAVERAFVFRFKLVADSFNVLLDFLLAFIPLIIYCIIKV